jgi:hypothetical protein
MKPNTRVMIWDLGPHRGKTGTIVGTRRNLLGLPKLRFAYIVQLDGSGEVIYTGVIKKLKNGMPMAV